MTDGQPPERVVVVTGDATMDWHLARTRRSALTRPAWAFDDCTRACWQRGGAALLADLILSVGEALQQDQKLRLTLHQTGAPQQPIRPSDDEYRHSYAMWSLHPHDQSPNKPDVWRVEEFLGHDRCAQPAPVDPKDWRHVVDDPPGADVVAIDDAGLGFRDCEDLWPQAIREEGYQPWVLIKMAVPVARGLLWDHLLNAHRRRLIVVMSVNDLRRTEVQISRESSWERTAQDLFRELVHNPRVFELSCCAHVVISLGCAGAFLLSRTGKDDGQAGTPTANKGFLFFDPQVIEGMWEERRPGGMIGYNTCLTASIARQLMLNPLQPDMETGVQAGLRAMRTLHVRGYGQELGVGPDDVELAFPRETITGELAKDDADFAVVPIPPPVSRRERWSAETTQENGGGNFWTILEERLSGDLSEVARQVALMGVEGTLPGVPVGKFGELETVDRREIESYRSIRSIVGEYGRRSEQEERPLSIAVFGPPGAGKSFAITQVAQSLLPGKVERLEFNLSQFSGVDDLRAALHQVRDAALRGRIPLVFWDEFDTRLDGQKLGWLRHFLVPMQDGCFLEGQIRHPLGRAIFVFAGGINHSMDEFAAPLRGEDKMLLATFRDAKGPDFLSRLKGHVDVLGPNCQGAPDEDPYHVIRRAILLRSILRRRAGQLFQEDESGKKAPSIDPGVLRAFLQTKHYEHGARSMEAIVDVSLLAGKRRFERSSLPAKTQLDLHVDGGNFLKEVQRMGFEDALIEELARAAHDVYRQGLRAREQANGALADYDDLPEELKEQNRDNVRDIRRKLEHLGYTMVPACSRGSEFTFSENEVEELAEMEHRRWMRLKMRQGYHYGPERDEAKKLNPGLLPWRKMSEEEIAETFTLAEAAAMDREPLDEKMKQRDRDLVRGIPRILAQARYTIRTGEEP